MRVTFPPMEAPGMSAATEVRNLIHPQLGVYNIVNTIFLSVLSSE